MNLSAHDDGAIIASVLAGDPGQFEQLVARYQSPLLRVALSRLGCHESADDVVQETFLCAFRSLHSYDSRYSFRTWLWTILLNQCRRHYRKSRRRPEVTYDGIEFADGQNGASPASHEVGPPAQLLAKEQGELLQSMLDRLPEKQADALRLRFFGELKVQEIADAMGCSLSSAKNRVRWGLTKMSEMLTSEVYLWSGSCYQNDDSRGDSP